MSKAIDWIVSNTSFLNCFCSESIDISQNIHKNYNLETDFGSSSFIILSFLLLFIKWNFDWLSSRTFLNCHGSVIIHSPNLICEGCLLVEISLQHTTSIMNWKKKLKSLSLLQDRQSQRRNTKMKERWQSISTRVREKLKLQRDKLG